MSGPWIDFKQLRKQLSLETVMRFYGVEIRRKPGNRHIGFCPLPKHQGKRKSASFSAKLDHNCWQCFGCKSRGNALTFAVLMEGLDPQNPKDFRTVALKLQLALCLTPGGHTPRGGGATKLPAPKETAPAPARPILPVEVNPPFDFELKDLDPSHPYLRDRGFQPHIIEHFGLGYCGRGLMRGRFVIPLHDSDGRLVGYGGRIVDDKAIDSDNPRYRLPGTRERDGKLIEFKKSLLLYNLHHLGVPLTDLIVVEGFVSVWWLTQWQYPHVVSLIGSDCSEEQARLIVQSTTPDGRVWVLTDGDDAGEKCAAVTLSRVAQHRWSRWLKLPQGQQPTDLTPGDLEKLLPGLRSTRKEVADGRNLVL